MLHTGFSLVGALISLNLSPANPVRNPSQSFLIFSPTNLTLPPAAHNYLLPPLRTSSRNNLLLVAVRVQVVARTPLPQVPPSFSSPPHAQVIALAQPRVSQLCLTIPSSSSSSPLVSRSSLSLLRRPVIVSIFP
ncbi:unnamed protein product [Linum trigynum]|uniref:Uncharacterized protein n=1 Tax=Linum trigynum TaxID=586398 RepID=A0AAV2CH96_9ROSI